MQRKATAFALVINCLNFGKRTAALNLGADSSLEAVARSTGFNNVSSGMNVKINIEGGERAGTT